MPHKPPTYRPAHAVRAKQDYDRQRGSAHKRGYGKRWQKYRRWFLSRNPMCSEPVCNRPATDVDHQQAVTGPNDPLFWAESNHRGLCKACHSRKTVSDDGGFGRSKAV